MIWQERGATQHTPNTLIVGKYVPDHTPDEQTVKRRKIAAFDFVSTSLFFICLSLPIVGFNSCHYNVGQKIRIGRSRLEVVARDCSDYLEEVVQRRWVSRNVAIDMGEVLINPQSFQVVVVSNQAGISFTADKKGPKLAQSKYSSFKTKVASVFQQLDFPITIYAATEKDIYRKPRTGMWHELLDDYDISSDDLNLYDCVFVGDAAGRDAHGPTSKDFSCSDR